MLDHINQIEIYQFARRRMDELDMELTRCGSRDKIIELRKQVLFIQEKLKEMELLEGLSGQLTFDNPGSNMIQ